MTSTTFDQAKFMKLMALTESDQDAESLSALRKAASMARNAGMSLPEAIEKCGGRGGSGWSSRGGSHDDADFEDFLKEQRLREAKAKADAAEYEAESARRRARERADHNAWMENLRTEQADQEAKRAKEKADREERQRKSDERKVKMAMEFREPLRIARLVVNANVTGDWENGYAGSCRMNPNVINQDAVREAIRILRCSKPTALTLAERKFLRALEAEYKAKVGAPPPPTWIETTRGSDVALQCLGWPEAMDEGERKFCESIVAQAWATHAQYPTLMRLADKVRNQARAQAPRSASAR